MLAVGDAVSGCETKVGAPLRNGHHGVSSEEPPEVPVGVLIVTCIEVLPRGWELGVGSWELTRYSSGGASRCHGVACSYACATPSKPSSSNGRPVSCRPIGRRSPENPH